MDLNLLQPAIEEILKSKGYRLKSLKFVNEGQDRYLRVIVDKYHHNVNLDEIVAISESINAVLDTYDEEDAYILEVTTTGAEKEIEQEELDHYVDTFIEVILKDGIKGIPKTKGTLVTLTPETLTLSVNEKGKIKRKIFHRNDIKQIKRAIKF